MEAITSAISDVKKAGGFPVSFAESGYTTLKYIAIDFELDIDQLEELANKNKTFPKAHSSGKNRSYLYSDVVKWLHGKKLIPYEQVEVVEALNRMDHCLVKK
jgi:hypothetical protein